MIVLSDWVKRLDELNDQANELPLCALKEFLMSHLSKALVAAYSILEEQCSDAKKTST